MELGLEVVAPARADSRAAAARTSAAPVEEPTEDVAQVVDAEVGREAALAGAAAERIGGWPHGPDLVVLLALRGVTQHVVCGGDLLEPLLAALVRIGVVLLGELAVGGLDLLVGG